jgi:hypothetical protein
LEKQRLMTKDLTTRVRQGLEATDKRAAPSSSGTALLARAEALLAPPSRQARIDPVTRAERVKIPVTCAARGSGYIVTAERRGDALRFVGHEMPRASGGTAARMPSLLAGQYRVEANGWRCPVCADSSGVWVCNCERMDGAIHCCGTSGGRSHCACGRFEEHEFVSVDTAAVRGTSIAQKPAARGAGSSFLNQPKLKQVTHE